MEFDRLAVERDDRAFRIGRINFEVSLRRFAGAEIDRKVCPSADFEDAADADGDPVDFRIGVDGWARTSEKRRSQCGHRQDRSQPKRNGTFHAGNALRRKEKRVKPPIIRRNPGNCEQSQRGFLRFPSGR